MIEVKNLCKSYNKTKALSDVTLSFYDGRIIGLLGPNGAGKTTFVSILTKIINKDKGDVFFDGQEIDDFFKEKYAKVNIVPQEFSFYWNLTGLENLSFFGGLYGYNRSILKERIDFCVNACGLEKFICKKTSEYSGGMKRRLNLAIGLLNNPSYLFLDEPTVGVDIKSRKSILDIIKKLKVDFNSTIIYTSHYLEEIEQISDDIVIINNGKIILSDTKSNVLKKTKKIVVEVNCNEENLNRLFVDKENVEIIKSKLIIDSFNSTILIEVLNVLRINKISINEIYSKALNMEEIYFSYIESDLRNGNNV